MIEASEAAPVAVRARPRSAEVIGVVLAAGSAVSYGVTVVVGRSLASSDVDPATALGVRFAIAAAVVAIVLAVRRSPLVPARGERLRILLLGAIGYTGESTLFFMSLQRGTAAAAALLFYAYPAIVTVAELALGWATPNRRNLLALGLSCLGTVLVVASAERVSMSATGAAMALGAAAIFAVYLLTANRLVHRTHALTQAAWVAAGAAVSSLGRGAVTHGLTVPADRWPTLLLYGAATASAFALMFMALPRLGASRLAVVMTLEAFSAVVLAGLFLHETITVAQALGGAAILAATAVVAGRRAPYRPPEGVAAAAGA
ncbi:MAG: DMT family transporter [Actinobacteria bacterium]|nr:DMT family transporter [Actinomycetota bacterium]